MSDSTRCSLGRQIDRFRRRFAQHGDLPFAKVLPAELIVEPLGLRRRQSLDKPVTVVWLFLSQVMHANPTLAVAAENYLAGRVGLGTSPCSPDTGGYARGRQRLPEEWLATLARRTGFQAERAAARLGRESLRRLDRVDARHPGEPSRLSPEPQPTAGRGGPLARVGVLFSLSVGTVLDLRLRHGSGEFQSGPAMLRDMFSVFQSGDLLLTDRRLCSYLETAGRGHAPREVDFRRGQRLGPGDRLVEWRRPPRPDCMTPGREAHAKTR